MRKSAVFGVDGDDAVAASRLCVNRRPGPLSGGGIYIYSVIEVPSRSAKGPQASHQSFGEGAGGGIGTSFQRAARTARRQGMTLPKGGSATKVQQQSRRTRGIMNRELSRDSRCCETYESRSSSAGNFAVKKNLHGVQERTRTDSWCSGDASFSFCSTSLMCRTFR